MSATVKMSAVALRAVMGESFDYDEYEKGRQAARKLLKEKPEIRQEKLEEVRQRIASGSFKNTPGPSYWVGCLCEFDFTW